MPTEPVLSVELIQSHVTYYYAMFQDIHVMMFIGFGFLMTFLKKYGFSSVGFNFLLAAFVLQWATLTSGWILQWDKAVKFIYVDMTTLISADFAAATILISFGAVLGKLSILQLIIMALIEVVAYQANELFVFQFLKATDVGDSMVVHTFGAYFGLTVAWITYRKENLDAEGKDGSVYQSDIFAMIGAIFLWLFWPSFNAATAVDEGRLRAVVNTYYSLTASCIVSFAISALVMKDKFNMVHIQNSTLAGGVAVGTLADMIIQPWGAILTGAVAGVVSVLGYRFLTPFFSNRLRLHDTCGVNNLHGMPGLISGLGSVLAAGLATTDLYGDGLTKIFPAGRSPRELAGYQAAALGTSFGMAIVCGAITGIILRIPIWNVPTADEVFDDDQTWDLPKDDDEDSYEGKTGQYRPSNKYGHDNSLEMQQRGAAGDDY